MHAYETPILLLLLWKPCQESLRPKCDNASHVFHTFLPQNRSFRVQSQTTNNEE